MGEVEEEVVMVAVARIATPPAAIALATAASTMANGIFTEATATYAPIVAVAYH